MSSFKTLLIEYCPHLCIETDLTFVQVLKLQYVHEPIQHLVISPNSELLAVVTEHTIHICVLPDTSHLDQPDSGPIRPKTQILGPTTHVLSQSAIVSALWHPLGVNGTCLVTITEDAVVRLWELNLDSRWSTEEPTLAVDLKKLQFARSSEDDVQPARIGRNRGFSADDIGMDVASACFGGRGLEEEGAWSAMTLWVAMTEGDIYALCPLLPSRWQPPPTLIPSLTNSIAVKRAFVENTKGLAIEKDTCDRQFNWLAEIDREDPLLLPGKSELSPSIPVYSRPKSPGAVPQLQGPFAILPGDIEDTLDVADIAVIAPTLDTEDLLDNEDDVDMTKGLISSLVCLLTTSGRLFVCLNLDGVEGRWLPPRKPSLRSRQPADDIPVPELVILEAIDTVDSSGNDNSLDAPPTFTPDIHSRYALYVSHNRGIFFFSLATLVQRLANELQEVNNIGLEVRMNAIANGSLALREQILRFREEDGNHELSAPVIMQDSDLGYFLLTVRDGLPQAATLDRPREGSESPEREIRGSIEPQELVPARLTLTEPRPAYQPPGSLYKSFTLRNFMDNHIQSRYKYNLKDEIRLSPATMEIIAEAHRLISRETFEIGKGISDLFARCDRMRIELKNQIDNVREIVEKVDHINEEDADDFGDREPRGSEKLDERLQRTKDKHAELTARYDDLKKKLAQSGGRSLSEREQGWVKEVDKLGRSLVPPGEGEQEAPSPTKQEYWRRFDEVYPWLVC